MAGAMDSKKNDDCEPQCQAAQALANSTLVKDGYVHVIPSTCQPGAAGLFSLGITCCIELAVHTHVIEEESNNIMYSYALFFAGLGQLICAIAEYQRKNTFGFTTWLCYSGYWIGTGFLGILYAGGYFKQPTADGLGEQTVWEIPTKGMQMANILWGFLSFLFWICTFSTTLAVNMLFLFLCICFMLEAAELTNPQIHTAVGVWGIITSALAFYIGTAVLSMEVYGKTYLPLIPLKWDFLLRRSGRRLGPYGTRKDLSLQNSESKEEV